MSIDEKVSAVQEFIDWREESRAISPLDDSLREWGAALHELERERLLQELRDKAEWVYASDDAAELAKFVEWVRESFRG